MKIVFPSTEFDDAVSAVCHGTISDEQGRKLNVLLRADVDARDEYILRLEVQSRLASDPDLFSEAESNVDHASHARDRIAPPPNALSFKTPALVRYRKRAGVAALAACFVLVAGSWWLTRFSPADKKGVTSTSIAMLDRIADVEWMDDSEIHRLGAPLESGSLRLKSGLIQVVFYSGARVTIQGPAEFDLISANEASLRRGRLTAEVPPQARGFSVRTEQATVRDLGTSFGLEVNSQRTELHVFKGNVELLLAVDGGKTDLREGAGAVMEGSLPPRFITARPSAFAPLFDLQSRSVAAANTRYGQWRATNELLNEDPSLLVHLNLQKGASPDWRLRIAGNRNADVPDAAIVGCQWTSGRWPDKRALEFQSVNDRVLLSIPGEFDSLTLAAWVRVQGLDRQISSLFMSDGFAPGTVHWLIRDDGVLGLTVIGQRAGQYQIVASPPVIGLDQFGMWLHLAVVIDGDSRRVDHYVNGLPVAGKSLRLNAPFRVGAAELGNWNADGFPDNDPFLIRNFSGAMDEFLLFTRALSANEIHSLHSDGRPQASPSTSTAEAPPRFFNQ